MMNFDKAFDLGMTAGIFLGVAITCVAFAAVEAVAELAEIERKRKAEEAEKRYFSGKGRDRRGFQTRAEAEHYREWLDNEFDALFPLKNARDPE